MSFEESVDYYIELLRLGFEGAKAADPKVIIAGLDVSGGDFRRGLKFKRAVLERAAGLLDLFTGHPYASPRYFGRGEKPKWPEESGLDKKCQEVLELLEEFGKPRRMWIGKLGWALDGSARLLGEDSLNFAACVARALVLAKSVRGVDSNTASFGASPLTPSRPLRHMPLAPQRSYTPSHKGESPSPSL